MATHLKTIKYRPSFCISTIFVYVYPLDSFTKTNSFVYFVFSNKTQTLSIDVWVIEVVNKNYLVL